MAKTLAWEPPDLLELSEIAATVFKELSRATAVGEKRATSVADAQLHSAYWADMAKLRRAELTPGPTYTEWLEAVRRAVAGHFEAKED